MLQIGIEQEFVFFNEAGEYVDADNTDYSVFAGIVDQFPAFEGDDRFLEPKSLERYPKRCYVEGFERHDAHGTLIETLPKALEIRTLPHTSVSDTVAEFRESYAAAMRLAAAEGLQPALVSRHPYKKTLDLFQGLGDEERRVRTEARFNLAKRAMFTHGLHVNVSLDGRSREEMQALVDKVCYYTPALIPWSYSSPFYLGEPFEGLCSRNYYRASTRNMVDLNERMGQFVVEFRGFDACGDSRLLSGVLGLFCGLLLDESLPGRASEQDADRLMLSSVAGYGDPSIRKECEEILWAATSAFGEGPGSFRLLETLLQTDDCYAARLKKRYNETESICSAITGHYDF